MLARGVRKSISDNIIARVLGGSTSAGLSTPAREGASTPASLSTAAPRHDGPSTAPSGDVVEIVYVCFWPQLRVQRLTLTDREREGSRQ